MISTHTKKRKTKDLCKKKKIGSIPQISKKEFFPPDFYYSFQQVAKKDEKNSYNFLLS
jgi:hypothetical protein